MKRKDEVENQSDEMTTGGENSASGGALIIKTCPVQDVTIRDLHSD